jgi:hypothetical protein
MGLVNFFFMLLNIYSFIITSKEYEKFIFNNDKFNHNLIDKYNDDYILHIYKNQSEKLDYLENIQYIAIVYDDNINLKEVIFNKHFINSFFDYNSSNIRFLNCQISLKNILNQNKNITIINSILIVDTDTDLILTDTNDVIKFYFSKKSNYKFKNVTVR